MEYLSGIIPRKSEKGQTKKTALKSPVFFCDKALFFYVFAYERANAVELAPKRLALAVAPTAVLGPNPDALAIAMPEPEVALAFAAATPGRETAFAPA